mgnify:CR=1 FL=1
MRDDYPELLAPAALSIRSFFREAIHLHQVLRQHLMCSFQRLWCDVANP